MIDDFLRTRQHKRIPAGNYSAGKAFILSITWATSKSLAKPNYRVKRLSDSDISDEDKDHAKRVWREFEMRTMGDYHNLYPPSRCCLLKKSENVCLENYDLDPTWYYIAPGLAWDAALKDSLLGANPLWKLELLTCVELLTNVAADRKGIGRRHLNDFKSIRKGK